MNTNTIQLPFSPIEDPFKVEHGGFYRRWLSMVDDIDFLKEVDDLFVILRRMADNGRGLKDGSS